MSASARTKTLRVLFGAFLLGSLLLEFGGPKPADPAPWDYPLFFALAGALGCVLLSVVAKGIVSPVLDRDETFYPSDANEYDEIEAQFEAAGASGGAGPAAGGAGAPAAARDPSRPGSGAGG
jgi:hypothetical protein